MSSSSSSVLPLPNIDTSNPSFLPQADLDWLDRRNRNLRGVEFEFLISTIFTSVPKSRISAMRRNYIRVHHSDVRSRNTTGLINIKEFLMINSDKLGEPNPANVDRIVTVDLTKQRAQTIIWFIDTYRKDIAKAKVYDDAINEVSDELENGVSCCICATALDPFVTAILCNDQRRKLNSTGTVDHATCRDCLQRTLTITHRLSSKLIDPKHPPCACGCESLYPPDTIIQYIPQVLMHTLSMQYEERLLSNNDAIGTENTNVKCPTCFRTFLIPTNIPSNNISCVYCTHRFCRKCEKDAHDSQIPCGEDAWMSMPVDARPCKNCGSVWDKDNNCAHVECKNCEYSFNFCCGTSWRNHPYYSCPFNDLPPFNVDLDFLWNSLGYDANQTKEYNIRLLRDYFLENPTLKPPVSSTRRKDLMKFEDNPRYFFIHPNRPNYNELKQRQERRK